MTNQMVAPARFQPSAVLVADHYGRGPEIGSRALCVRRGRADALDCNAARTGRAKVLNMFALLCWVISEYPDRSLTRACTQSMFVSALADGWLERQRVPRPIALPNRLKRPTVMTGQDRKLAPTVR
jgi:hypothetical protein